MRMTATQAFKKQFVERSLAPMLANATDGTVSGCRYCAKRDDEWVDVTIERPPFEPRRVRVNVSLDSKWAIVRDVMRRLADEV